MAFSEAPEFYLVWSAKTGKTRVGHKDVARAMKEAHRLSVKFPGDKFYVLKSFGLYQETQEAEKKKEVIVNELTHEDVKGLPDEVIKQLSMKGKKLVEQTKDE